jgi:REP element-mobilizing transposase RayT
MTRPRATLVSVADTPYYHCIGRCVRRAFLCGEDALTGRSFSHRRQWMLDRLVVLTEAFAIDVCAFALMSNHYHLVVRIDSQRAEAWTPREVVERWTRLFRGPDYAQRYLRDEALTASEQVLLNERISIWASRLTDLSWFMRCLNEWLARRANQEDDCTGRFWEGRFNSQALLDDTALLTMMAYVDLNPIRAGIAETPIDSDFTSLQQRLFEIAKDSRATPVPVKGKLTLLPFAGAMRNGQEPAIPFNLQDYIDLVDTSGRLVRDGKHGAIPANAPTLLATLGIEPGEWFKTVTQLQTRFECFLGSPNRLRQIAKQRGWCWIRGISAGKRLYMRANE